MIFALIDRQGRYVDMEKIAFLETNESIVERAKELLKEQIHSGEVVVCQIGTRPLEQKAWKLVKDGFQAIITRGGHYQDIAALNLGIPVVRVVVSASDILLALNHAAKSYKKVKLVLHQSARFNLEEYGELIRIEVECYWYNNINEPERMINSFELNQDEVIVGTGLVQRLAVRRYLNFINIMVQDSTLLNAYVETKRLLKQVRQEALRSNLLESVLHQVNEGVAVVTMDGRILHFNRKSEELLGIGADDVKHVDIDTLLPGYHVGAYRQLKPGECKDMLITDKQRNLAVSTSVLSLDQTSRQLLLTIQNVTQIQHIEQNIRFMLAKKGLAAVFRFEDIKTKDAGMKGVIEQAKRLAVFDGTVLICGDSGTGKELFAQSIHTSSARKNGPFVAVNCAAINENLLESELFGYVGGAFTGARKEGKIGMFELAHKGTIFLDEVNSMPLNLQAKLLRVIEQQEVMRVGSDYVIPLDVRIIAASNRELVERVQAGEFRRDLYFRLNTFELAIPPLNERKGDIVYLFKCFLADYEGVELKEIKLEPEFEQLLKEHDWWGNVRELRNTARRYYVYRGDNRKEEILKRNLEKSALVTDDLKINIRELNKAVEEMVILSMMNHNVSKTDIAKAMGISRQALFKKLNN